MGCGASTAAPPASTTLPTAASASADTATSAADPKAAEKARAEAKAEERTLRSIFNSIDVDGDGSVTKRELQAKLQADTTIQDLLTKSGGSSDYVMDQLDVDGDGHVTFAEFEMMLSTDASKLAEDIVPGSAEVLPPAPPPPEAHSVDKLKALFDKIDASGDGKVSREELRAHMAKDDTVAELLVHAGGSKEYVFEQLNEDDDAFVTWDEFKSMLGADVQGFVTSALSEEEEAARLIEEEMAAAMA